MGNSKKFKEPLNEPLLIMLTKDQKQKLLELSAEEYVAISVYARKLILKSIGW